MSFPELPHLQRRRQRNPNTIHAPTIMLNRLKQPSTIKGILVILSIFGVEFSDGLTEAVAGLVIAAIGVWEIIRNERKIPKAEVVE